MRNPGGAMHIVGTVDKNGSGVPFALCTKSISNIVMSDTAGTEILIASNLLSNFFNNVSNNFIITPPNKKV